MKKFYEKDLEEIIFNASEEKLEEKGLCGFNGKKFRQLRIGNYGRLDLMTVSRITDPYISYLDITIYELKEDKIGISAFFQAISYARGIQRYLTKRGFSNYRIKIRLIGSEIDKSGSFCYLPDLFCNCNSNEDFETVYSIEYFVYKYDLDGILFTEESGFKLEKEDF